jgi:hypothetical protein
MKEDDGMVTKIFCFLQNTPTTKQASRPSRDACFSETQAALAALHISARRFTGGQF